MKIDMSENSSGNLEVIFSDGISVKFHQISYHHGRKEIMVEVIGAEECKDLCDLPRDDAEFFNPNGSDGLLISSPAESVVVAEHDNFHDENYVRRAPYLPRNR